MPDNIIEALQPDAVMLPDSAAYVALRHHT